MSRAGAIQLACLYGPLAAAVLLVAWRPPNRRLAVGLLFAWSWNAALLPWVDAVARAAGWWSYQPAGGTLSGLPLALYFGWTLAWGVVAPLLARALGGRHLAAAGLMVGLDLLVMPELWPVVRLYSGWLAGEVLAVGCLLAPSMALAHWTATGRHAGRRAAMTAPAFGGLLLGIPLLVVSGGAAELGDHWRALSGGPRVVIAGAGVLAALTGLTAVRDLGRGGEGTPVPLDPPRHLVTHGIYAYVRNPMQISMTVLLLMGAAFLASPWLVVLAVLGTVYSSGFARWSEDVDMRRRFGASWYHYRATVRTWWPGWRPGPAGVECELWLDADCQPCREVAEWFHRRAPRRLLLRKAADWPGPPLRRATWRDPASGRTESGVAAIAMALQHLNLAWALLGWVAGLPVVGFVLQACFDAAGAGPHTPNCKRPTVRAQ